MGRCMGVFVYVCVGVCLRGCNVMPISVSTLNIYINGGFFF